MTRRLACGVSWAAMSAALLLGAEAQAQTRTAEVSELIVTAQRVEENLQDVPVAVTAFSARALERAGVETLSDIALRTPGFSMGQVDSVQQNFAIRGIGSAFGISQNSGGDPSVVVFVDGVYVGKGGVPDIDAMDLQRIEVLRGPQGTLFGKNAVGGLIQFVSRKPQAETSLRLQGQLGNYERRAFNAHGNIALADNVFLSGGVALKKRDGYEFNQGTGNRVNNEDLKTARAALRFLPSEDLDIVLSYDVTDQDQKGNPRDNICDATLRGGIHCVGINPDPRITNAYTDGKIRRLLKTYRAEVNWTTPLGVVTSVTGLRDVKLNFVTPFFANPVRPPNQIESTEIDHEKNQQFSQEVRLAFGLMDERLRGQVGFYYLNEDNNRTEYLIQDFPAPAITGVAVYPQAVESTSTAIFGQVSFDITDALTATLGARMTWEEKDGHFIGRKLSGPGLPPPLAADYDVRSSETWDALTPRLALDWRATEDVLVYVSAARGFKSGGYQGIAGNGASQATPYDPEYAWSYEAGAKTQWLDNRLRLNVSVFKTDYEDLQTSQLVPLCCVVVGNAATAEIEGAEIEWVVTPLPGLQIDGSYAYLDARFTSFATGATGNFTGNRLPRSPEDKLAIGVQYEASLADGWTVLGRVDYANQSKLYFEASNIPTQKQEGYINWDARVALTSPDETWQLAFWGKNLTDELVATYVTAFAPYRQVLVPYAPPKTYGVTLTWRM
ncbi:TonB-dependent receptor [Phenylobacterium sp.]|uniref:TonB-dependent receptor n=1 Tax=Phenylobacterium sp. TaxID=1871053 RepID=UPI0039839463